MLTLNAVQGTDCSISTGSLRSTVCASSFQRKHKHRNGVSPLSPARELLQSASRSEMLRQSTMLMALRGFCERFLARSKI